MRRVQYCRCAGREPDRGMAYSRLMGRREPAPGEEAAYCCYGRLTSSDSHVDASCPPEAVVTPRSVERGPLDANSATLVLREPAIGKPFTARPRIVFSSASIPRCGR